MTNLVYLIPLALSLGGLGLAAFVWNLHSGQYDDLDGAAHRVLFDEDGEPGRPAPSSVGRGPARDTSGLRRDGPEPSSG